jgi:TLD
MSKLLLKGLGQVGLLNEKEEEDPKKHMQEECTKDDENVNDEYDENDWNDTMMMQKEEKVEDDYNETMEVRYDSVPLLFNDTELQYLRHLFRPNTSKLEQQQQQQQQQQPVHHVTRRQELPQPPLEDDDDDDDEVVPVSITTDDATMTTPSRDSSRTCSTSSNDSIPIVTTAAADATTIPILSSLLYRVCVVYFDICAFHNQNTTTYQYNATTNMAHPSPPRVWDLYFTSIQPVLQHINHVNGTMTTMTITRMDLNHWIQQYIPMIPIMVATVLDTLLLLRPSSSTTPKLLLPSYARTVKEQNNDTDKLLDDVISLQRRMNLPPWMTVPVQYIPTTCKTTTTTMHPNRMNNDVIVPIQLTVMGISDTWRSIYTSDQHGLSFTTMTHQLLSYYGPTILIVETTNNEIFGYYTNLPWKLSTHWYTNNTNDATQNQQGQRICYQSDIINS